MTGLDKARDNQGVTTQPAWHVLNEKYRFLRRYFVTFATLFHVNFIFTRFMTEIYPNYPKSLI